MKKAEQLFHDLAENIPGVKEGKMFGSLCLKTSNGKSCAMLWKDCLVVKLGTDELNKTLKLKGITSFEPMKGRPMKEWLQVPLTYADLWEKLALKSLLYVNSGDKKKLK